jgi:hypothetical protein
MSRSQRTVLQPFGQSRTFLFRQAHPARGWEVVQNPPSICLSIPGGPFASLPSSLCGLHVRVLRQVRGGESSAWNTWLLTNNQRMLIEDRDILTVILEGSVTLVPEGPPRVATATYDQRMSLLTLICEGGVCDSFAQPLHPVEILWSILVAGSVDAGQYRF